MIPGKRSSYSIFIILLGITLNPTSHNSLSQNLLQLSITHQHRWLTGRIGTITGIDLRNLTGTYQVLVLAVWNSRITTRISREIGYSLAGRSSFIGRECIKEQSRVLAESHAIYKGFVHVES